jgi:RimJ/RimL family protein N-acetyltransferase
MTTADRDLIEIPSWFDTERLYLRSYRAGDGPWYYAMARRNRAHLARYEAGNAVMGLTSQADAEAVVQRFAADWEAGNHYFIGAFRKADGLFVAQVYVGPQDSGLPSFVIGYFGDVDHGGRGYVTEAVQGTLGWLFEHLRAHRVTIYCDDTNERSARVAQRCGFCREGHLRETHRHGEYPVSGDYVYGLLRREYLDRAGADANEVRG